MAPIDGLVLDGEAGRAAEGQPMLKPASETLDALPPEVHHEDVIGCGQVDADSTGLDAQDCEAGSTSVEIY